MKCCILMGSPRKKGNTIALLEPFLEELEKHQIQHDLIWLYDKNIKSCIACRTCQNEWTKFGCIFNDVNGHDKILINGHEKPTQMAIK